MVSLDRLLELAGLRLTEDMSQEQAESVFARAGFPSWTITTPDDLQKAFRKLQFLYHENGATPDGQRIASINAARDVLRNTLATQPASVPAPDSQTTYQVWAWDGRLFTKAYSIASNPEQFSQVAISAMKRLRSGFKVPKAVLLQDASSVFLIAVNGHAVTPQSFRVTGDIAHDATLRTWLASQTR